MTQPKFRVGEMVRLGGPDGRMPSGYTHLRKGRVVKVKAVVPNANYLGLRHCAYVIAGRRGKADIVCGSYELRKLDEPKLYKGPGKILRPLKEAAGVADNDSTPTDLTPVYSEA